MKKTRGAVLVSLLAITIVVLMFLGALLVRGRQTLFQSAHYRDSIKAEQAARAGVNHCLALLEDDLTWGSDLQVDLDGAAYFITFDPGQPYFSVNNLTSPDDATQLSFQGHTVAPLSADVVVVGSCGLAKRRIRVVLQKGLPALRAVSAGGKIHLDGDVDVDGVKSLLPPEDSTSTPESAPGGLLSKYQSPDPSDPAISWTGTGTFNLSSLSELEAATPLSGGLAFNSELTALFPDRIIENGAADAIPEIDVGAKVAAGMGTPTLAAGGSIINGHVTVDSLQSVNGDLTVNGDLLLTGGTVYIDGDLNLNGGIKGRGTVYVSGDVTMVGGNTLVQTGEPSGATLLSGGNVSLQGIDAAGYLQSLALGDPAIDSAFQNLTNRLEYYETLGTDVDSYYSVSLALSKTPTGTPSPSDSIWMSPLPGPDGTHYMAWSSAEIPALTIALRDTGLHLTDPRAEKVVSALEEMHYHFRDNGAGHTITMTNRAVNEDYQLVESGVLRTRPEVELIRNDENNHWDDRDTEFKFRTHTALAHNNVDGVPNAGAYALARKEAYFLNNPLDFSWLGDSTFQGLVYARGNVEATQGFKIIGGLTTLGNVELTGGSKLIYNEEYRDLLANDSPIAVVHFEEL